MNFTISLLRILLLPLIFSCEKITYYSHSNNISTSSKALVHAASGASGFEHETFDAVKFGLAALDGIEVDIQQSKDGTLWLSHDSKVFDENGNETRLFVNTSDNDLEQILSSDSTFYYTRLETVFQYLWQNNIKKHISLDVKRPIELITNDNYKEIAANIINMADKFKLENQVLIESSSEFFLKQFNGNSLGIETYYFCLGDFDKGASIAIEKGFTGISFKYNSKDDVSQELIELLHEYGLKMQIFYVNEPEVIEELYGYEIDFLQTDNLDFYSHI